MKAGSAQITMKDIYSGAYCGACHNGQKAFASSECTKCHDMKGFDKELVYKVEGLGAGNIQPQVPRRHIPLRRMSFKVVCDEEDSGQDADG